MYEKLWNDDPEDVGLLVNAVASHVSGDCPSKALSLLGRNEEHLESSYELCFNLSCALIEAGSLKDAETRLMEAKELCVRELLEAEEIPEEDAAVLEDHEELAAIQVQHGCVLQRQGDADKANTLYNRVLRPRAGQAGEVDVTVLAVACNNVVALRSEGKNLFDSLKRINVASKESLEHKLTRNQNVEIAANKCLLLMQAKRVDEARKQLEKLRQTCPDHPRVAVVQAAIAHREKKSLKACEEVLQNYIKEHGGHQEVILPLAQLYTLMNRHQEAVEVLAKLPLSMRAQPKTIEAIVAHYLRQKTVDKVVSCLREAIGYWSDKDDDEAEQTLGQVLRLSSRLAMQVKDRAFAAEVYQLYLEKVDGSDNDALCGLVEALSSSDPPRAAQYALRLQVPEFDHLDPEELEQQAIPKIGQLLSLRKKKELEKDGAEGAEQADEAKKKRRKRKPRYPKGFDPENPGPPPDPERWLPKRERAEFKKKMKKRDKSLLRGPQGAMVVDENLIKNKGPSTAQVEVAKDSSRPSRRKGKK
eukprot:TRINITY_DN85077_c0_g1_i1.p1 TRINITY_DN85077_c0_g1~~TRINITY_DN85077_c0_g1_i1.p1  ORF type:complete len:537 (-),score=149.83 TRINITY_DN85077_c0_g1_i1:110-1699(-)